MACKRRSQETSLPKGLNRREPRLPTPPSGAQKTSARPSRASPVPEDPRHPPEDQSNPFLTTFAKCMGTVEFLSTCFTRVLAGCVRGSGASPIFLGGTLPQGPISQRAPGVQSSLPMLQSQKGWEKTLRLGAHPPLPCAPHPPFFI